MDTIIPNADDQTVTVSRASGFVVVSWWQDSSSDGRKGGFEYDHKPDLNSALDLYREFQDGEHARATAMGVFSCDAIGLPLRRLDPNHLMRLMAETRAA